MKQFAEQVNMSVNNILKRRTLFGIVAALEKCQNMPNDAFLLPNVPKCAQTGNHVVNLF